MTASCGLQPSGRKRRDGVGVVCARGVRFVADYETGLGAYELHRVEALRPLLTQFRGPTITVRAADEIGRVEGAQRFDEEGDSALYIWRLSRCDGLRGRG